MYIAPKFWLGNDSSSENFGAALAQHTKVEAGVGFSAYASSVREELGLPSLVQIQEGVAVVHISGDLISGEAGYMALFGSVGYDDLRDALMQALVSPEVGSILLHVNSGGGMVAGCEDFAAFLKQVATYKPLTTYADNCMCSAGYWIGSHGQHISTNRTATIGSLGVVMMHFDRSQSLAADGIRPTVVRSGKYKMLTNSVEPLSPVALEELQTKADVIYSVFIEAVAATA